MTPNGPFHRQGWSLESSSTSSNALKSFLHRCVHTLCVLPRAHPASPSQTPHRAVKVAVTCSYLEIYQEQLTDLLRPGVAAGKLAIREDLKAGVFVEGLTEEPAYAGAQQHASTKKLI